MDDYKDIIDLPHHTSKTRPRMSIEARSAQFAPFSALTGYDEAVKEAGRRTNSKIEIDDYFKEYLSNQLNIIKEHIKEKPEVTITYFKKDLKKSGGEYLTYKNNIKKIDEIKNLLVFVDNIKISISEIINISSSSLNLDNEYY